MDNKRTPCYQDVTDFAEALMARVEVEDHHGPRVRVMCMEFAQQLDFDMHRIEMLGVAGSLHDIGKLGMEYITNQPRKLTPLERNKIRSHTVEGYHILHDLDYDPIVQEVARLHHEDWDGNGYEGLMGETIPVHARIVRIVDVWDALTHNRPNRAAWSVEAARTQMADLSGIFFDPHLLQIFLEKVIPNG